jgi:glycerol kinase
MMSRYVIGVDQGTTGTFVELMDETGKFIADAYHAHRQICPQLNWVEHDAMELWHNVVALTNQVIEQAQVPVSAIAGLGLANQGESVVMWDAETGAPLYNVIVWQDTRTQSFVETLARDAAQMESVHARTGLQLDAYFSASKIRWLLQNVPAARDRHHHGKLRCGTLDVWLIWMLTAGQVYRTDPSTASRTLLFNIHTQQWDESLLRLFEVPPDIMPEVVPTTAHFGEVRHPDLLCQGIPIVASIVDQPAAMVGHACLAAGDIKTTYGTGCFINMNTQNQVVSSRHGLLTLLAWKREDTTTYGLDGGVLTAGTTINWLCDRLHLADSPEAIDRLCEGVRENSVIWIPAQIGLGPPYWDRALRAAWLGIGLETERAHLVYAVLEGIAIRVAQIVRTMAQETGLTVASLRVDGGLTNNRTLMQLQADLLGFPVEILSDSEATARGVCYLAARQAGMWLDDDMIKRQVIVRDIILPAMAEGDREARFERFDRAIRQLQALEHS